MHKNTLPGAGCFCIRLWYTVPMQTHRGNTGSIILCAVVIAILGIGIYFAVRTGSPIETNNQEVPVASATPAQDSHGLRVDAPLPSTTVGSQFTISGSLNMGKDIQRRWIVFEGQAGRIEIRNPMNGELITPSIPFALPQDWMEIAINGGVMQFAIPVTLPDVYTGPANIIFIEDDPSGELAVVNTLMLSVAVQ